MSAGLADDNDINDFAYFLPQVDINEEDFWDGGGDSKAGIKKGRGRGRPKGSGSGVRGQAFLEISNFDS